MYKRLYIPGPTDVDPAVLEAMATPVIGHRTKEVSALQEGVSKGLQKVFRTENPIILSTSSGTGLMEGAVRCFTKNRAACFSVGDFGSRWHKMAEANNVQADLYEREFGDHTRVEDVDAALSKGIYDCMTITHNETSTGVVNPLEEICTMVKEKYPDVIILVDAVSSMAGVPIEVDKWGIDVCITSAQKCFGLPPGMAVASMSLRAYEKAKTIENRGYYFDYVQLYDFIAKKNYQYPSTPSVSHYFAFQKALELMEAEGLEARYERHARMAKIVQDWAEDRFALFVKEPENRSLTVTTVENTRGISVKELNAELAKVGYNISNGYGSLKEKTFRIAHMGWHTEEDVRGLLDAIDTILEQM